MKVPFLDLYAQYLGIREALDTAIQETIQNSGYIGGSQVRNFENRFARMCNISHAIGVGNGTDALFLALRAMGIGPGDLVAVPAFTFIATSEAVSMTGARPIFIDVDPIRYTLDPERLEETIASHPERSRIKAVIPVHLYGRPAQMDRIQDVAKKHGLFILEDCAQAHFALFNGQPVGSLGDAAAFSFYPGKNLGAYGDAGMVVTGNSDIAEKVRMTANHGRIDKYDHKFEGVNSRLDGLQAAILNVKLDHIQEWSNARHRVAGLYNQALSPLREKGLILPEFPQQGEHVYHLYVVRSVDRDSLRSRLEEKGIQTGIHYPIALPNLTAYSSMNHTPEDFPVSTELQNTVFSLPIYPELQDSQIEYIAQEIKMALS